VSIRSYILSLMKDERNEKVDIMVKSFLKMLSRAYEWGVKFVDRQYRTGARHVHKVSVPVISVGNITVGGTGKTPFTIYLADHFLNAGKNPAVLIRGYGDDEHRMLRDELPDVPVLVGQNRAKSANAAVRTGSDVLILDDGFQHRRVSRDLNILLLDSAAPFGNGCLLPRGILREPVPSLKRADMIVLVKSDRISAEEKEKLVGRLADLAPEIPVAVARHKPVFFADVTGMAYSPEDLKGKRMCLVSGIADPGYFALQVKRLGGMISTRFDFTDHHGYTQKDIDRIRAQCSRDKIDAIVVTKKDYVKMRELDLSRIEEKIFILHIVIEIIEGKEKIIAGLNSVICR